MKNVISAFGNLSAIFRAELAMLAQRKPEFAAALKEADQLIASYQLLEIFKKPKPRVLITVTGGVAEFVSDPGVDIEIFDRDNTEDNSDEITGVSFHFADLAASIDVTVAPALADSVESEFFELSLDGFYGGSDATDHLILIVQARKNQSDLDVLFTSLLSLGSRVLTVTRMNAGVAGDDVDFIIPEQMQEFVAKVIALTTHVIKPCDGPTNIELFPGAVREEIGSVMMSAIVGDYDTPDQVPEWAWVDKSACFTRARNGQDGIWEFVINLGSALLDIPEKLKPMFAEARAKNLSYVIIHQGT